MTAIYNPSFSPALVTGPFLKESLGRGKNPTFSQWAKSSSIMSEESPTPTCSDIACERDSDETVC